LLAHVQCRFEIVLSASPLNGSTRGADGSPSRYPESRSLRGAAKF
jgi:hypothetical protein